MPEKGAYRRTFEFLPLVFGDNSYNFVPCNWISSGVVCEDHHVCVGSHNAALTVYVGGIIWYSYFNKCAWV